MQPLRLGGSQRLLLSKLSLRSAQRKRTRGEEQVIHASLNLSTFSDRYPRCARNCFMCPHCRNTLSVVPSDPPDDGRSHAPINTTGEPPFYLYCNFCRWDSGEVGITLEKPTGLASELTRPYPPVPRADRYCSPITASRRRCLRFAGVRTTEGTF